jgi:hypothetical protein
MRGFIHLKNNNSLIFYFKDYMDQCAQEYIDNTFYYFFYNPEIYINLPYI